VYSDACQGTAADHRLFFSAPKGIGKSDTQIKQFQAMLYCGKCASALFTETVWKNAKVLRIDMAPADVDTPEGREARLEVINFCIALRAKRFSITPSQAAAKARELGELWWKDQNAAERLLAEIHATSRERVVTGICVILGLCVGITYDLLHSPSGGGINFFATSYGVWGAGAFFGICGLGLAGWVASFFGFEPIPVGLSGVRGWILVVGFLAPLFFPFKHVSPLLDIILPWVTASVGVFLVWQVKGFVEALLESLPPPDSLPNKKGNALGSLLFGIFGLLAWIFPLFGIPATIIGLVLGRTCRISKQRRIALTGIGLSLVGLLLAAANSFYGGNEQAMYGPGQLLVGLLSGRAMDFLGR
jgi:hypothetical protein